MCIPAHNKKSSRPTVPCDGPRMNRQVDVGNPPRPFRHLRMTERRTPDPSSSRAPVHSALVQKSVTVITNPAGQLSLWMLGELPSHSKRRIANSWQNSCNQSNNGTRLPLAIDDLSSGRSPNHSISLSPPPSNCSSPAPPDLPHPSAAPSTGATPHVDSWAQCSTDTGCAND